MIIISGYSQVMGSILKELQIRQYIVAITGIGRTMLDSELVRFFQRYFVSNPNFFCNSNNTEPSFESGVETLELNSFTRVMSIVLPQYYALQILLTDFGSLGWLQSCEYLDFFKTQTSALEQGIVSNISSYINNKSHVGIIIGNFTSTNMCPIYFKLMNFEIDIRFMYYIS